MDEVALAGRSCWAGAACCSAGNTCCSDWPGDRGGLPPFGEPRLKLLRYLIDTNESRLSKRRDELCGRVRSKEPVEGARLAAGRRGQLTAAAGDVGAGPGC